MAGKREIDASMSGAGAARAALLTLFATVAAVLVFAKSAKFVLLLPHAQRPLADGGLATGVALLAAGAGTALLAIDRRRGASWPILTLATFATIWSAVQLLAFRSEGAAHAAELLEVMREEWIIIAAASAILAGAFAINRRPLRIVALAVLSFVCIAAAVASLLDLRYFASTGALIDGALVRYLIANRIDAWYPVGHEFAQQPVTNALVIAACALFLAAIVPLAARATPIRTEPARLHRHALMAIALLLIFPRAPLPAALKPIRPSTLTMLFHGAWDAQSPRIAIARPRIAVTASANAGPVARPNVVLIIAESQRSLRRLPRAAVPFVSELATRSLVAERMYAVVPHTNRALVAILCGEEPQATAGRAALPAGDCLPRRLAPLGYSSAFFTPAPLAFERAGEMLAAIGFDEIRGNGSYRTKGFQRVNYFGFEDRVLIPPAMEWIDGMSQRERPFFVTLMTTGTHHPYRVPNRGPRRRFGGSSRSEPYFNAAVYVDGFIRDVHGMLKARGLLSSTIFIVIGDHGQAFGEHGRWYHSGVIWDETLEASCIIHAPSLPPRRLSAARSQLDLVPTVLDLVGAPAAGGGEGISLLRAAPPTRRLYHATWIPNQGMALREGGRKYIHFHGSRPMEVYDVERDPLETESIAARIPAATLERVSHDLLRWRKELDARAR